MGRKIPARKHRGVLDPIKQRKQREEKLKNVINAPPTTLDQPVPKSMLEFARLKEIGRKAQFKSSGKKKNRAPDGAYVRQAYGEDKGKKSNTKSKLTKKTNGIEDSDPKRSFQKHQLKDQEQSFDDSDDEIIDKTHGKSNWKDGTEKRNKNKLPGTEQKKKVDRRIEKRKKLLEKRREKMEEKVQLLKKDIVAFGEVAHEPPSMRVKPKYAAANERQMGMKDLHLKRMLDKGTAAPVAMVSASTVAKPKVRLRDLPARERDIIEGKQQDAIAAYRLLKAKKYSANNQR